MTDRNQPEEINEESLKTLIRGITKFPGEFSLILARCNYADLRKRIVQQLREQCTVEIRELVLEPSVQTLYGAIAKRIGQEQPNALMVFGLESVKDLDHLLTATNQIREEFRNFAFPLVLWVTDEVLQKLIRLVPDFYSWATTVEFEITTEELIDFIQENIDRVFDQVLASRENIFIQKFDDIHAAEVELAAQELKKQGVQLEPELAADLEFALGFLADNSQPISRQHYERSLELCQKANNLEQCGHSLWFLGRWWRNHAARNRNKFDSSCDRAQAYFQQCIETLERANKPELVAKYINPWAEILHRRSRWEQLEQVTTKALKLHQTYPDKFNQARAKGFLAEIALAKSDWTKAQELAQQALALIDEESKAIPTPSEEQQIVLNWVNSFHRGWYLFSLAKAQKHLGQGQKAISRLKTARDTIKPNNDPGLYIGILGELRDSYFQQGEYLTAFKIKQQKSAIESQFNFSAFIGAGRLQPKEQVTNAGLPTSEKEKAQVLEFAASGREQDIKRLVGRIYRDDMQLTVIYGQSGVGKSSIIEAGLIPALKQKIIDTRRVLPVVQRVYRDWIGELEQCLVNSVNDVSSSLILESLHSSAIREGTRSASPLIQESPPSPPILGGIRSESISSREGASSSPILGETEIESILIQDNNSQKSPKLGGFRGQDQTSNLSVIKPILEQLQLNSERNLLTVLIFDQFEEFFFDCQEPSQRKVFYDFLQQCLALPYVKVILSLREDYLHYLLECNRLTNLEAVNNDILNKNILYYLGNFSTKDAKSVIKGLTEHTQFSLKPDLVERLVQDLAAEIGEVRPIELQVVGAELQAEKITTLKEYQNTDTKEELVERYLDAVVKDCGEANQEIAQLILYLLTDEKNTRPLKTQEELVKGLAGFDKEIEKAQLDLVLTVLRGSRLVFMVPAPIADQYQLVHDYLAAFVRKQQEEGLVKKLREAKEREQKTQAKLARLTRIAIKQRKKAEIGEIQALASSATALLASHQEIEALIEAIKMGTQLKKIFGHKANEKIEAVTALQKVVYAVRERNRFEEHSDVVESVSFSPDGKTIASSGATGDQTVKLWNIDGTLLQTFQGHDGSVTSVSFSPDGKIIASASFDNTVKLWSIDGILLKTLQSHTDWVWSVSLSPDGKIIASASADDTVKLWNLDGKLTATFQCNQGGINEVSFSPDGKTLASAGNDGTIKFWNLGDLRKNKIPAKQSLLRKVQNFIGRLLNRKSLDRTLRQTFDAHIGWVRSVSFSPDGTTIVSGGRDKTVKLWNLDGTLRRTLQGHGDEVRSVRFSADGKTIASSSTDQTIKLWKLDGTLLKTIQGHDGQILEINFSPDGKILASASADYTVKLWSLDETLLKTIPAHVNYVQSVSFSPDGKTIASASNDSTVKLWKLDGTLLKTIQGHNSTVKDVSFSPNGKTIASASWDGTVKLWNLDGTLLRTLPGHNNQATSVSFSPDGKTIASGGSDSNIKLWNIDGTLLKIFSGHSSTINSVSFSPDGKTIASASYDQTLKLWSLDGTLLKTLQGHDDGVDEVNFSPDGKTLASASWDGTVKLWSLNDELLHTLRGHGDEVWGMSFNPDGTAIVTGGKNNTIKVWSLDGKLLKILQGHKAAVIDISFSPDGKTLASASADKTVILWNLDEWTMDVDALLERGCNWLQDYLTNRPEKLEELETCKAQYQAQLKESK